MKKTALLSAVSAIALAASFAPAHAFDSVEWSWGSNVWTDVVGDIDFSYDFVPSGLTQVERLQVMAGNMSAYADGSYANYSNVDGTYTTPSAPIYINQSADASNYQAQLAVQANLAVQAAAADGGEANGGYAGYHGDAEGGYAGGADIDQSQYGSQKNLNSLLGGAIAANILYIDMGSMTPYYAAPIDARKHLAKVEISAAAISNIASIDSEEVVQAHDGQIAIGGYVPVLGEDYDGTQIQDGQAADALGSWIGFNEYYNQFGSSGNRMYDTAMLERFAAQYGLVYKGQNTSVAYGDYITNAQVDVSATSAANIHSVSLETRDEPTAGYYTYSPYGVSYTPTASDNLAVVDLTQFGYMDTTAVASATHHTVSGYNYLGKIDGPVLKVNASALGNVSSVVNKVKTY